MTLNPTSSLPKGTDDEITIAMTDVGDISFGVTVLVTVTVTVVEDIEVEDVVADEDDIAVEEVVADEDDIAVEEVVADEDDIELEEDDEEVVVPIT